MNRKQSPVVRITAEVDLSDLDIFDNSHDDLFTFICSIDDRIADYEFTERLRDHFAEVLKKEDAAIAKGESKCA